MNLDEICKTIYSNGFQCYLVGGAVRDKIRGYPANDYDIATNARPEELLDIFKGSKINLVGQQFKVIKVDDYDIATFRKDIHCENGVLKSIEYADSIEEDLARRDLTINSIAINYQTGEMVDPFDGISDIKNGIIKFVGDPYMRILEDCHRILRACRFYATLGNASFDESTFEALKDRSTDLSYVSKERIMMEVMKAMKVHIPSLFFQSLKLIGGLKYIFPTLDQCYFLDGGKYHNETVFNHCMMCGDYMKRTSKNPLLTLTAYLHDVGKIFYKFNSKGEINFIDHEDYGYDILQKELSDLKFSNDDISYVSNVVKYHMLSYDSESARAIRRILKKLDDVNIDYHDMIKLFVYDRASNLKRDTFDYDELYDDICRSFRTVIDEKENAVFNLKFLDITGHQIMEWLDIPQGKRVGDILKHVQERILDGNLINKDEEIKSYLMSNEFDLNSI